MNSKYKIIFISYIPLTQKLEDDFYVQYLLDKGFKVNFWDITDIYYKNIRFSGELERDYIEKIRSFGELKQKIREEDVSRVVFIPFPPLTGNTIRLYRLLTKHNCRLYFLGRGVLPEHSSDKSFHQKAIGRINLFLRDPKKFYIALLHRFAGFLKLVRYIKEYDMVFVAGSSAERIYQGALKLVPVNHFDYDNYLSTKDSSGRLVEGKYCVYLDMNYMRCSNLEMLGLRGINADIFCEKMNGFFDAVERKFDVNVIIAAHPLAEYCNDEFCGRKIIKNGTNQLVKDCDFVISHFSTSLSYAILYEKPVMICYTSEMKLTHGFKFMSKFAEVLDCSIYDIDKIEVENDLIYKRVNQHRYRSYKYNYLTMPGSESIHTRDIFVEHLSL